MSLAGKALGRRGEAAASAFLETRGYTILETNYQTRQFEIDIIATTPDALCFIEVKTRSGLTKGLPREGVSVAKQNKILMGAAHYLKKHRILNQRIRFDVVEVLYDREGACPPRITLIPNAFTGQR